MRLEALQDHAGRGHLDDAVVAGVGDPESVGVETSSERFLGLLSAVPVLGVMYESPPPDVILSTGCPRSRRGTCSATSAATAGRIHRCDAAGVEDVALVDGSGPHGQAGGSGVSRGNWRDRGDTGDHGRRERHDTTTTRPREPAPRAGIHAPRTFKHPSHLSHHSMDSQSHKRVPAQAVHSALSVHMISGSPIRDGPSQRRTPPPR